MKKNIGFTLLEIVIVIAVFSIGILATFKLVSSNLEKLDETKTRNIATFLAKEGIELIYNLRDSNLIKELKRDCIFTDKNISDNSQNLDEKFCDGYFGSGINGKYLQIGFDPNSYLKLNWTDSKTFDKNQIYYNEEIINNNKIFFYNNNGTGEKTKFARYIVFTGVVENGKILALDKILKLESHVLFKRGSKTGEIILESFIGNY